VVTVGGDSPSTEAVEFLESAADTLAIGMRQARQKASIDDLESETEQLAADVSRQRTLLGSFTTAIATAVRAESRTELFETLTEFCEANWEYGWVGSYHPADETVSPTVVGSPGGPATTVDADGESGRSPPMLAAATDREPVYIKNTRATQPRSAWARRLLTYGYQSALAVPICEGGVLHGVVEVTASETAGFDEQARQLIAVLCQAVAIRLNHLNRSEPTELDDKAVVFELVCSDDRPLFPSLPAAASVDVRTISTIDSSTRTLTITIEGVTADRFERYVHDTPGFEALVIAGDRTDGDHVRASVQLTTTARDQTHQLFETARRNDAAITPLTATTQTNRSGLGPDGRRSLATSSTRSNRPLTVGSSPNRPPRPRICSPSDNRSPRHSPTANVNCSAQPTGRGTTSSRRGSAVEHSPTFLISHSQRFTNTSDRPKNRLQRFCSTTLRPSLTPPESEAAGCHRRPPVWHPDIFGPTYFSIISPGNQ
jgi:GAF domain.